MRIRFLQILCAALLPLATVGNTSAEERYYMLMFAAQGNPNLPYMAHTSALFVKTAEKDNSSREILETSSISWMPKDLSIELLRINPVPGVNLDLAETNRWAKSVNARMTMWGPFEIKKDLYDMAAAQVRRLGRGEISFVVLDRRFRGGGASNCIHALSDLDTTQPALVTGTARGNAASLMVLQHFERYIIPTKDSANWLIDSLELNASEISFATMAASRP